jgi:hypothetical protein
MLGFWDFATIAVVCITIGITATEITAHLTRYYRKGGPSKLDAG